MCRWPLTARPNALSFSTSVRTCVDFKSAVSAGTTMSMASLAITDSLKENLLPTDKRWFDPIYWSDTYVTQYTEKPPSPTTYENMELVALSPPDQKPQRGRPKKKRYRPSSIATENLQILWQTRPLCQHMSQPTC